MDSVSSVLDQIVAFLRAGFNEINGPQGLLIALASTVFLRSWKQWLMVSVLATVAHLIVDILAPVLAGQAQLRLPPIMEASFWNEISILFAGYLVVIAIFFALKSLIIRASNGGSTAKAH